MADTEPHWLTAAALDCPEYEEQMDVNSPVDSPNHYRHRLIAGAGGLKGDWQQGRAPRKPSAPEG